MTSQADTMPATILELACHRLGRPASSGLDFEEAGLQILGGCEICHATLAGYNAYPSRSGFWRCFDCIGDEGYATVELANAALFADGIPGYRLEPDGTVPAVDNRPELFSYPLWWRELPLGFLVDFCSCESSHCQHHGGRVEDGVPMCDSCPGKPSGRFSMDWLGAVCDACALANPSVSHPIVDRLQP